METKIAGKRAIRNVKAMKKVVSGEIDECGCGIGTGTLKVEVPTSGLQMRLRGVELC